MSDKLDESQPPIIKKKKGGHGHHHATAWKVAYADFVTAMMAFFLLLWLLSTTTEVERNGIADYFTSSPMITRSEDGSGGVMGGKTISPDGAMVSDVQPLVERPMTQDPALRPGSDPVRDETNTDNKRYTPEKRAEMRKFDQAASEIRAAIEGNRDLAEMAEAVRIEQTTEGLRIQILEQQEKPLFNSGSADPLPDTKKVLREVANVINGLPNEVSIRGHTDSVPYGPGSTYTNWELSADRANAARKVLRNAGVPAARINNVVGKADTDHLFPDDPRDGRNRRISIVLLFSDIAEDTGPNRSSRAAGDEPARQKLYQRTEGKVEFP
jgi:chemotaxis protein MotB